MCNLSLLFTTEENNNYIIPEFNCTIITKYDAIEKKTKVLFLFHSISKLGTKQ